MNRYNTELLNNGYVHAWLLRCRVYRILGVILEGGLNRKMASNRDVVFADVIGGHFNRKKWDLSRLS